MKRLAIVGCGELGCLLAHHAIADSHYQVAGFYDDHAEQPRHAIGDVRVLGTTDQVLLDFDADLFDCLMIGVGYAAMTDRKRLFDMFALRVPMGTIVHSGCFVDPTVSIGSGVFLMPGCVVDYGAKIGDNVTCQVGSIISHHSTMRRHTFLGPAVKLAGYVDIGEGTFVGCGVTTSDCLEIGSGSVIGAGSVVTGDIPSNSLAVGVPATVIKDLA